MANATLGGTSVTIGSSCTNHMNVTIDVPGPGFVVVWTTSQLSINHVSGTNDNMRYLIGTTASDCLTDDATQIYHIDASLPSSTWVLGGAAVEVFTVDTAGTFTYYLNAVMVLGADAGDKFNRSSLVAVFYPSS